MSALELTVPMLAAVLPPVGAPAAVLSPVGALVEAVEALAAVLSPVGALVEAVEVEVAEVVEVAPYPGESRRPSGRSRQVEAMHDA